MRGWRVTDVTCKCFSLNRVYVALCTRVWIDSSTGVQKLKWTRNEVSLVSNSHHIHTHTTITHE